MKIKDGVLTDGLRGVIWYALGVANMVWARHGQELVLTSGTEGKHSVGSLHYYGLAADLRTNYFGDEQVMAVAADLRAALGGDYDVVVEELHVHIEYDPEA